MSSPHITALEELRDWLRGLAQEHRNNAARHSPESVFAIGNLAFAKDRDKWADALDSLLAEREKMVAIPEGWKLVPRTTTEAMRTAMLELSHRTTWFTEEMWQAALAAAPQPPKGEQ